MSKQIRIDAQARADALMKELCDSQLVLTLCQASGQYTIGRMTAKFELAEDRSIKLPDIWIAGRDGEGVRETPAAGSRRQGVVVPTAAAWDRLLMKVRESWPEFKERVNGLVAESNANRQRLREELALRREMEEAFMTLGIPSNVGVPPHGMEKTLAALKRLIKLTKPEVTRTRVATFSSEYMAEAFFAKQGVSAEDVKKGIEDGMVKIRHNASFESVGRFPRDDDPRFEQWEVRFPGETPD